jgi:hypothetical protein
MIKNIHVLVNCENFITLPSLPRTHCIRLTPHCPCTCTPSEGIGPLGLMPRTTTTLKVLEGQSPHHWQLLLLLKEEVSMLCSIPMSVVPFHSIRVPVSLLTQLSILGIPKDCGLVPHTLITSIFWK